MRTKDVGKFSAPDSEIQFACSLTFPTKRFRQIISMLVAWIKLSSKKLYETFPFEVKFIVELDRWSESYVNQK